MTHLLAQNATNSTGSVGIWPGFQQFASNMIQKRRAISQLQHALGLSDEHLRDAGMNRADIENELRRLRS